MRILLSITLCLLALTAAQAGPVDDVKKEMQYKKAETIKRYFPDGWISGRGGLRIKTISFARQLAEL